MRILVTGGAGFIGSHTVDKLIAGGCDVVVIDRRDPPYKNDAAVYYRHDLNDPQTAAVFEKHGFDAVIHLAAQASVAVSVADPVRDGSDNVMASVRVIELCKKHGVKKIVVSSSAALYAAPQYLPVDEKHPVSFLSPYAVSKHTMEEYVKLSGIDHVIFRYANVYGPRQDPHGEAGVVSTNARTSINKLFSLIGKYTDYTLSPNRAPARAGDIKHSVLNNAKAAAVLGFTPQTALEDGLRETVEFFKRTY